MGEEERNGKRGRKWEKRKKMGKEEGNGKRGPKMKGGSKDEAGRKVRGRPSHSNCERSIGAHGKDEERHRLLEKRLDREKEAQSNAGADDFDSTTPRVLTALPRTH
eukprot:4866252-Pleurochrysis_carterae.AAC.1